MDYKVCWFALLSFFLLKENATAADKVPYIVYLGEPPRLLAGSNKELQYARVAKSHNVLLGSILGTLKAAENAIFYSYTQHINGFAATIDEETANKISSISQLNWKRSRWRCMEMEEQMEEEEPLGEPEEEPEEHQEQILQNLNELLDMKNHHMQQAPQEPVTESTLRTSARIPEKGEIIRYGNTNARMCKTGKEKGGSSELDLIRQVQLLEALYMPLKQGQADQVDSVCGIMTSDLMKDMGSCLMA